MVRRPAADKVPFGFDNPVDDTTRVQGHHHLSPAVVDRNDLVSQFLRHSFTGGLVSLFGDFA